MFRRRVSFGVLNSTSGCVSLFGMISTSLTIQNLPAVDREIDRAITLLGDALHPREVLPVIDIAEMLRFAVKRAKLGFEAANKTAELRLRAERRLGELLMGRVSRGRPKLSSGDDNYRLDALGISRDLSARAQRLAAIPPRYFEWYFREALNQGWEVTTTTLIQRTDSERVGETAKNRQFYNEGRTTPSLIRDRQSAAAMSPATEARVDLRLGDCLEILPDLPARSVDLILCDLPYGGTRCDWDCPLDLAALWGEFFRVLKPNRPVIFFATQPFASHLVISNPEWYKAEIIWIKNRASDFIHARNRPTRIHENILVFSEGALCSTTRSKRRMPYYPGEDDTYPASVVYYPRDLPAIHPTQKPVALLEFLIGSFSQPGELVLDPTMGSGSTGVAAIASGRSFVGFERDPHYYDVARSRIEGRCEGCPDSGPA